MTAILKCDCRTCATIGDDFAPPEWKDQRFDFCPECEGRMHAAIDSVLNLPRLMSDPETDQVQPPPISCCRSNRSNSATFSPC